MLTDIGGPTTDEDMGITEDDHRYVRVILYSARRLLVKDSGGYRSAITSQSCTSLHPLEYMPAVMQQRNSVWVGSLAVRLWSGVPVAIVRKVKPVVLASILSRAHWHAMHP